MSGEKLSFALSRPVQAHGEDVSELSFREPTGSDIIAVGNPVVIDMASDPPKISHDERKLAAMLARLAEVPPSTIGKMAPQDFVGAGWLITPFFVPTPGAI